MTRPRNIARYLFGVVLALVASTMPVFGQITNAGNAISPGFDTYSLAIDPGNPNVIYVGTYNGVFKSTDGGSSWRNVSPGPGLVQALAIDPISPNNVYAGTFPLCRGTPIILYSRARMVAQVRPE